MIREIKNQFQKQQEFNKKGSKVLIQNGGGVDMDRQLKEKRKVLDDFKQQYISREYIKEYYPEVSLND